jgi:hypothetical protein
MHLSKIHCQPGEGVASPMHTVHSGKPATWEGQHVCSSTGTEAIQEMGSSSLF